MRLLYGFIIGHCIFSSGNGIVSTYNITNFSIFYATCNVFQFFDICFQYSRLFRRRGQKTALGLGIAFNILI